MSDRVIAVLLVVVLTVLTVASISGKGLLAGPQLFALSESHGVHAGDFAFVAAWVFGVACCLRIWRRDGH